MLKEIRKRISNRRKKSWRKNIDSTEFENYLEDKLRDERVGSLDGKKDEEIFVIDTKPIPANLLGKKKKVDLDKPRCFHLLQPSSAVEDPIKKRNRVRTKEERKHPIRKKIEECKRASGILSKKASQAKEQSEAALKKKKLKETGINIKKDVWGTENKVIDEDTSEWLNGDTVRHNLTNTRNLKVKVPKGVTVKKSTIPSIEHPHPGMSYNPSYEDHQALLGKVTEKELELLKEEAHIARTTTQMFTKVSPEEKERLWIEEMSQGIIKEETIDKQEDQVNNNEYKAINPPTNFEKKKTLKQRRKQKEQKEDKLLRKKLKVEKKKVADIYKLKYLTKQMDQKEKRQVESNLKRKEKTAIKKIQPKRLGLLKYTEPDLAFTRTCDLRGSLRSMRPEGHLLADRFYSMQKRNILVPSLKVTKFKKAKVKRFVKASHKIEEEPVIQPKKTHSGKIKMEVKG